MMQIFRRMLLPATALMLVAGGALAQCPAEPVAPPTSGYGSNGALVGQGFSFRNPVGSAQLVFVFYPVGATPAPTIFFSHPYGGRDPSRYVEMIAHFNSLGYAVVYPQYPTIGAADDKYDVLWSGIQQAAERYPELIDTRKVAFFGHSFGGGASPRMVINARAEGWGSEGTAMYVMAPWYSLRLSDNDLAQFPTDVKANFVLFDQDTTNDHEMALDVYSNLPVPASEKALLKVFSDTESGCTLTADHGVPNNVELDGLDYYNWVHMDALLDYAWNGSAAGKSLALGNGSAEQTYWGTWFTGTPYAPAQVGDAIVPTLPSESYDFPCESEDNPRIEHCDWPVSP